MNTLYRSIQYIDHGRAGSIRLVVRPNTHARQGQLISLTYHKGIRHFADGERVNHISLAHNDKTIRSRAVPWVGLNTILKDRIGFRIAIHYFPNRAIGGKTRRRNLNGLVQNAFLKRFVRNMSRGTFAGLDAMHSYAGVAPSHYAGAVGGIGGVWLCSYVKRAENRAKA